MTNMKDNNNVVALFREWAVAYVKETYGYEVTAGDSAELSSEIVGEGCCELCYTESSTVTLTVGRYTVNLGNYFTG